MSLERFISAQQEVWPRPLQEIRAGEKTGHWMWFVLPQLRGLGRSAMAERYGIAGLDEARAYLAHPVLGTRLREVVRAMLDRRGTSAAAILGPVDAMKLRSCATLFRAAGEGEDARLFDALLQAFHGGEPCAPTEARLRGPVRGDDFCKRGGGRHEET